MVALDEHMDDIVVEEDEDRIVAFAAVCSPTIGVYPSRWRGRSTSTSRSRSGSGRSSTRSADDELPYRNELAEDAEEYGLNGTGAGDEQAVD